VNDDGRGNAPRGQIEAKEIGWSWLGKGRRVLMVKASATPRTRGFGIYMSNPPRVSNGFGEPVKSVDIGRVRPEWRPDCPGPIAVAVVVRPNYKVPALGWSVGLREKGKQAGWVEEHVILASVSPAVIALTSSDAMPCALSHSSPAALPRCVVAVARSARLESIFRNWTW
jgi:hypothetical protein